MVKKARTDTIDKAIKALELNIIQFENSQALRSTITRNGDFSEKAWLRDAIDRLNRLRQVRANA